MNQGPSIQTHVPITAELPEEPIELASGRPDLPTPSLWQASVSAKHKVTGRRAIVVRVDWNTNMFRAFYPEEGDVDPATKKPKGRFSERTEWEQCERWDVDVTFSPQELDRQAAVKRFDEEISQLDATALAAVSVLCDDPNPVKALAKLEALRRLGIISASPAVAAEAVAAVNAKKK